LRFYFAAPYGILKYTKPLAIIYFIISIFKILLMVLLVKNYGVYGIIISTFLASGFEIILLKFGIQSKFKFEFNFFKLVFTPLLLFFTVILIEPLCADYPLQAHLFYFILVTTFLIWVYRKELKSINFFKFLK
jgi:O-antigen/teichoic acid export membrane protein